MSDFLDFLSIFGEKDEKNEARDRRYSGFREQTTIAKSSRGYAVLSLGRSGQQFQLCYNLKSVVCKSASTVALVNKEWSIRQAAFHHQFDVQEGTTLWIVAQGRKGIKTRIQELTGKEGRTEDRDFSTPEGCFRSSLAVHLLYCHWSTEGWRWYVQWLEEVIEENVSIARAHEQALPMLLTWPYRQVTQFSNVVNLAETSTNIRQKISKACSTSRIGPMRQSWSWKLTLMF
jgi:hypothetical protein